MGDLLRAAVALAAGFLLGSVLPAELIARARGVDIRTVGDGNPGTINAFKGLGWGFGLVTAVYDVSVGVVAILFAKWLGLGDGVAYLAGLMAVVGHVFPLYRGFRGGGQGMGASAGLLVYGVGVALARGWLSWAEVGLLVVVLAATFAITRNDKLMAVVMLPVLLAEVYLARPEWQYAAFMTAVAGYIWAVQVVVMRSTRRTRPAEPAQSRLRT